MEKEKEKPYLVCKLTDGGKNEIYEN